MELNEPPISVRSAGFRYASRTVFAGLDFDVAQGEVLCILGRNGCGKSTLLRCLGGELRTSEGSVRLRGIPVAAMSPVERARRVAFVFQQHVPSFPFAVIDVVSMGRAPHLGRFGSPTGKDRDRAGSALERVGVAHLRERPYTEISGGERQMVMLARALVQDCAVILLDEPTAHLDLHHQVLALQAIRSLASDGITMVMTTHDPNQAFLFDGRVALMGEGRFIAIGAADDVIDEVSLARTYGVPVGVYGVERKTGQGRIKFVTPWPG